MDADPDGFFVCDTPMVPEGQRYGYQLDDRPVRPDPCSLWQPDGVHRPSAVYFPERFQWTDASWRGIQRGDLVIYEIHVGTFTEEGTFDAVIPRLDQLRSLGITALEIMPVAQFPGTRNWGYDGVHLFAAQNSYGGPQGLQRLIDAAHAAGMGVLLDVVFNHFGPEGNYTHEFGPYGTDRYRTPWGPAFNFDGRDSDPVRDFVLDNVWHWIHDFHVDGLRLDAVHAMFDSSPGHILREIKETADAAAADQNRPAIVIAESLMNDVRMVLPPERGGHGLDAEWNEDFHHALVAYLTGEQHGKYIDFGPVEDLPIVLEQTFLLSGAHSRFRGRRWGASAGGLPGDRFVIGLQNHDHVGNRAAGERIATLVPVTVQRLAASLMLLAPHLPLLFMGEEYGETHPFLFFCAFEDPRLVEAVRVGRRRDYSLVGTVPDPFDPETFATSRITWSWPEGSAAAGLRRLYGDLIDARRQWPALRNWTERTARLVTNQAAGPILELIRGGASPDAKGALCCYFNLSASPWSLVDRRQPEHAVLFRSESPAYQAAGERAAYEPSSVEVMPSECVVMGPSAWKHYG
jgi:maltooligosyltrehalose trehalohydrolase